MESAPQSVSPHIQRVLKSFQTSANRTLQGPGGVVMLPNGSSDERMLKLSGDELTRKSFDSRSVLNKEYMYRFNHQVQQLPVFTPADNSRSERTETLLENEKIACFNVGGEKRLCLPQIFKTVLKDLELSEINAVCDDLRIFCSRCQPEQLEILKLAGDLPSSAQSCGLITKTDAERLCNALLNTSGEVPFSHPSPNCFKVYHECFGKCGGNFNPDAYTAPNAYCIQCTDCGFWLTPPKFVCHSHKSLEKRTCHWGFDSSNWRSYILLAKHQPGLDKLRDILEQVKSRFDTSKKYKRKSQGLDTNGELVKRCRGEDAGSLSQEGPWESSGSTLRAMMSAFQPWPPTSGTSARDCKMLPAAPAIMREGVAGTAPSFLHSGPPVLLHPDKVVPHSESSRYEPNYAPNVSLAPVQKCKGEDDEEEEERDGEADRKSRVGSPEPVASHPSYQEWDLSESDDSSVEHSSPSHGEDSRLSPPTENQRALEIELEMIRQALDGKIGSNKEEKDRFLHEFCKLRSKHQECLNRNIQARRNLKQELANAKTSSRERHQEASEQQALMEREMDKYRKDSEARLKEVKDDNAKLLKDVQIMQDRDEIGMGKIHELQGRLQQCEMICQQLHVENIVMREKLHQLGVNVLDLTKGGACNRAFSMLRSPSGSPPQRSPTEVPTPHLHPGYLHLLRAGLLPVYTAGSPPSERFIKKEHDGT